MMETESSASASKLVCIGCSAIVQQVELSKCIVHSCCSRPVCAQCLSTSPRLATCCVLCEGAQHALRKGPRNDVVRAGQTLFDFHKAQSQNELEPDGDADADAHDVAPSSDDHHRSPPPHYSDVLKQSLQERHNNFVLEDDEDDKGSIIHEKHLAPSLIDSSLQKRAPASDAVESNSIVHQVSSHTENNNALASSSLRNVLSSHMQNQSPVRKDASNSAKAKSFKDERVMSDSDDDNNLTRQYWLRPNDTLMSLSLRFGVNTGALCRLNDLPASSATLAPHLIHTRRFLLIPQAAIEKVLASSSSTSLSTNDIASLESALQGPAPMSKVQKVQRARREAQSRFRALVTQHDAAEHVRLRIGATTTAAASTSNVTPCDERAAKAYISLMEEELRFIDFGDGFDMNDDSASSKADVAADDEALRDAAQQRRYEAIVKQAVCRWEMDSDWERGQRAMGLQPETKRIGKSTQCNADVRTSTNIPSWLRWTSAANQGKAKGTIGASLSWAEKGR